MRKELDQFYPSNDNKKKFNSRKVYIIFLTIPIIKSLIVQQRQNIYESKKAEIVQKEEKG